MAMTTKPHAEYTHYDTHHYRGKQVHVVIEEFKQPEVTISFGTQELKFNKVNCKDLIKTLEQAQENL